MRLAQFAWNYRDMLKSAPKEKIDAYLFQEYTNQTKKMGYFSISETYPQFIDRIVKEYEAEIKAEGGVMGSETKGALALKEKVNGEKAVPMSPRTIASAQPIPAAATNRPQAVQIVKLPTTLTPLDLLKRQKAQIQKQVAAQKATVAKPEPTTQDAAPKVAKNKRKK